MRVQPRYTRRRLLKVGGLAAVALMLDVFDIIGPRGAIAATRHRWTVPDRLPAGAFQTPTLRVDGTFNAVDVSWVAGDRAAAVAVAVRLSLDGASWSDWLALPIDTHIRDLDDPRTYCVPLLGNGIALQVRVDTPPGADVRDLAIGVIDTTARPDSRPRALADDDLIDGFIIPRAGWGADEALRHEDQDPTKPIAWPPTYQPVEKIIIHHTATANDPDDPTAAVRAIYYFHAVTRGWGDIGYNFLVDWQGRVYEGRFGGPNVVGGHALQYNYGSLGVALLGNFETAVPPEESLDALVRLIETRAPHVDVTTAADFIDLVAVPNLCGHGDVLPTSCPGEHAHELIPELRGRIAGTDPIYLAPPVLKEAIEVLSCDIGPTTVYTGNLLEVRMTVANPSITTLVSSDPPPGYIYDEGEDFATLGFPKVAETYRFGVDVKGASGTPNPYRWGFGPPLEPGETREVVGYVRVKRRRATTWTASIVKEFVRYVVDHDFPQRITVADPPIGATAALPGDDVRYFPETGHNVPGVFARYWEINGGLPRFGYPLTEPFEEVSETDGGRYLTQYFERARFEYHPEYAGTKDEVLLGLLGSELTRGRHNESPFRPVEDPGEEGVLWFAATGHTLRGRFLRYWEANGGLPIFGYPITEEFRERSETDGQVHTVQYFERNRFEYHPDYAGTKDEVMLGHLARELLIRRGWLAPPDD